jgi:hypothetical protein
MALVRLVLSLLFVLPPGSLHADLAVESRTSGTAVLLSNPAPPTPLAPEPHEHDDHAPTVIFGGLAGDGDRWVRARDDFRAAGLSVAGVDVVFSLDAEQCSGHLGVYRHRDGEHKVWICNPDTKRRRLTLMHELAHAWAAEHLSDSGREEFLDARGLSAWNGPGVAWAERGTEHAAEIIAWGVSSGPCWLLPRAEIGDRDPVNLTIQLKILTGIAPRCDAHAPAPDDGPPASILE